MLHENKGKIKSSFIRSTLLYQKVLAPKKEPEDHKESDLDQVDTPKGTKNGKFNT